jgi:hypothetical protein
MRVARSGGGRTGDRHRLSQRSHLFIQAVTLVAKKHGLLAVKLTEIPVKDRLSAARRVARDGTQEPEALVMAALFPSDKVYFVRAQAVGELPCAA